MKKVIMDKSFLSIIIIFILGILFGILFYFITNNNDKEIVFKGIEEYLDLINKGNLDNYSLLNIFISKFILLNIIFISSFSIILFPLIHFVNFYKGLTLGFSFSILINIYKLKGILYSLVFLFPHELLFIPFIILISSLMLKNTYKLYNLFKNDKAIKIRTLYKRLLYIYLISFVITLLISLSELYINTYIIKSLF